MKKIYLSLLSVATAVGLNAQTLTQANHAPANGDSYNTTAADGAVSPGASGAGANWNFTSITVTASPVTWSGSTNSNASYPSANVKVSSTAGDNLYFESSAGSLKYYGGDLNLSGIAVTLTYTSPAIYAVYPMSLNTSTNNLIGGSLTAATLPGTFTGTCSVIADGTGTMTLPGKNFNNIVRVKTTQDIRLDVPMASVSNGTLTQVNYEYYQTGFKQPMFTISTSTVNAPPVISPSSNTILTVFSDYLTVGIDKNFNANKDVVIYPNPASTSVNFVALNGETLNVKLYSLTGALVKEVNGTESVSIDLTDLQNGLYIYTLTKDNKEITSGKVALTH